MQADGESRAVRQLIQECLDADREAVSRFQQEYGELIYGYPIRVYRTPADDAGDFYVFAFESGRIFRRLRTFEGRAPFRAYLVGFVLDDLVLEWKRAERSLDTVSLDDVGEMADPEEMRTVVHREQEDDLRGYDIDALLADYDASKSAVLKLLYAEDTDLTPDELRYIARSSQRPMAEVLEGVESLRESIRDREAALRNVEDNLDSVQAWIQLYERRLRRIDTDLRAVQPSSVAADRLRAERDEITRKISKRSNQREKLGQQVKRRKVTAPYKEIAHLLNTTVGNVGSQIARLRTELNQKRLEIEAIRAEEGIGYDHDQRQAVGR